MKPRIASTVIISVLVLINLFFFVTAIAPVDLATFIGDPLPDNPGEIELLWGGLAVGIVIVLIAAWALSIALTHAICLIFTIKNRNSSLKAVRIINLVLDVANVVLILGPIIKIASW